MLLEDNKSLKSPKCKLRVGRKEIFDVKTVDGTITKKKNIF